MISINTVRNPFLFVFIVITLIACNSFKTNKQKHQVTVDVLIENGLVYTGLTNESQRLNIGVCGQHICYLGSKSNDKVNAKITIDAKNLVITPGFIDPHTHTLDELLSSDQNNNANYLTQGVTTVLTGNDGEGSPEIAKLAKELMTNSIGTNVGLMVGHNSIREAVMGKKNSVPTDHELHCMKQLLKSALQEGAMAFSSGLYYVPGIYSSTEEVIELAKIAAKYNVPYDSHIRDESSFSIGILAALKEFIEIVDAADVHGHIAHIKALGVDVWGKSQSAIDLINDAKRKGMNITADQYPWAASGTYLHNAVIPKWALEGDWNQVLKRINEAKNRERLMIEIKENIRKRGGPSSLLITASKNTSWLGKRLYSIARKNQTTPSAMVLKMMNEEQTRIASFNMSENDIINFMQQDWVVTSSDGTNGHPRKYASFPNKYQKYVLENPLLNFSEFVNNSTAKTAEIFGIIDRGSIRVGLKADINIIELGSFKPHADFSKWNVMSTGVVYQLVNGSFSISDSKLTHQNNGQVILNKSNIH